MIHDNAFYRDLILGHSRNEIESTISGADEKTKGAIVDAFSDASWVADNKDLLVKSFQQIPRGECALRQRLTDALFKAGILTNNPDI